MKYLKFTLPTLLFCLLVGCCSEKPDFVTRQDGRLYLNGEPYTFVGANFWYGSILGSEGQSGDRARLIRELDTLHALGINNLRIMAGADGRGDEPWRVTPCLQTAPGVYNDTLLAGLDFLLSEMGKRDMKAVIYLNNAWDWSGGYVFYLEHSGYGATPNLNDDGYPAYVECAAHFATDTLAQQLFYNHAAFMISRTNRYTGKPYKDDPTIMTWQIGNEPRPFSEAGQQGFINWLKHTSALIRSIDANHLISIGSEGIWGCDGNEELHRTICADPNIDYLTAHIWPMNWSWVRKDALHEDLPQAIRNTDEYIAKHIELCRELNKPLIIEEFGFPRDGFSFDPQSPATARDTYMSHIIDKVNEHNEIVGLNFWTWGGLLLPHDEVWHTGDPLIGDPPQEQQGLNSVFPTDTSTINLFRVTVDE